MRARVTEQGLVIPKEWLLGISEVELRQENNQIIIIPLTTTEYDPIFSLGNNPITLDITDASVNHDKYIIKEAE